MSTPTPIPIKFVDLNVADLSRSVDFYTRHLRLEPIVDAPHGDDERWLLAGPVVLRLRELRGRARPSGWIPDDLQCGFRHIGFSVVGIDERVEALHEASVPFHLEPINAEGGVRITFFFDPDGVLLEYIEGHLDYHAVGDIELVEHERSLPTPANPTFNHVAMTATDRDATVAFYRDTLGFGVSGQLFQLQDERGFEIDYLHAGDTVLELFTFKSPTTPSPWTPDDELGFRQVVFAPADPDATIDRLKSCGASPVSVPHCHVLLDRDGFPLGIQR